ncbi:hypothetical protein [Rhizobium sp. 1399]|uniref:hypothetical protein n=1 Tax=Rhizobium sp. 1399 TaxID=2817758 RepID=UPI00285B3E3D|nr:hypothetical protein [Rhizobium sp. 1399]MDR6671133.1 hypothetical protein [Rhizobium sp. 1399]
MTRAIHMAAVRSGTFSRLCCCKPMSDTEQKASKGMIKFVLTILVIAMLLSAGYLTFITLGSEVEPNTIPPVGDGDQ